MPLLLLVGASSSLLGKANPAAEESFTRRDVLLSGLLHFLRCVGDAHPEEAVAVLVGREGACRAVSKGGKGGFTTTKAAVRAVVDGLKPAGEAPLEACLDAALRHAAKVAPAPVQVVAVSDAWAGAGAVDAAGELPERFAALGCRLHAVTFGGARDAPLDALVARLYGSREHADCVAGGSEPLERAVYSLAARHFAAYGGALRVGHWSAAVRLAPDPNLVFAASPFGLRQRVPRGDLEVVGFVDAAEAAGAPALSAHAVVPAESPEQLTASLAAEMLEAGRAAVVCLDGLASASWFGVLRAVPAARGGAGLELTLLDPARPAGWVARAADRMVGRAAAPEGCAGGGSGDEPPPADLAAVEKALAKAHKAAGRLARPEKLLKVCRSLQLAADLYAMPGVRAALAAVLRDAAGSLKASPAREAERARLEGMAAKAERGEQIS